MDNSPTALFDSYEQDFKQLVESVREKLEAGKDDRGEQRKAALRRVDMELDEAEEMVSQMEIEVQGIPQSIRQQYQARLKSSKAELSRYKKLCKDSYAQLSRSDLLSSSRHAGLISNSDDPYTSDRTRLLSGTAILEDSTRRLQDSHRIALETEVRGAETLDLLRQQREQIEHARETLHTADVSIDRAGGTLKKMIRRMYQQRFVTAGIIFILVVLIVFILWAKLR